MHTLTHYYLEFAQGNPGGFILLHILILLILAVIVHEWFLADKHVCVFDPDMSVRCRDTSGNVTHLLCTYHACDKWERVHHD